MDYVLIAGLMICIAVMSGMLVRERNQSARKAEKLAEAEMRALTYQSLLDELPDMVMILNAQGQVIHLSNELGFIADALDPDVVIEGDREATVRAQFFPELCDGDRIDTSAMVPFWDNDTIEVPFADIAQPKQFRRIGKWILPTDSSEHCFAISIIDVTQQESELASLRRAVNVDYLTGLFSRRALVDHFEDSEHAPGDCLLLIDLDHFKGINDSYGHSVGDDILKMVGQVLAENMGRGGVAARLGGEEFALLRGFRSDEDALAFAEVIRTAIEDTAVKSESHHVKVTASIGIRPLDENETLDDALFQADRALQEAKQRGRNTCVIADAIFLEGLRTNGDLITSFEIEEGLRADEFYYALQPIWNVDRQAAEGFEALLRWNRRDGLQISPAKFALAYTQICRQPEFFDQAKALRREVIYDLTAEPGAYVSFNVDVETLSMRDAADVIADWFDNDFVINDRQIVLEISEASMSQRANWNKVIEEIEILRKFGYRIALDDFGREASNLLRFAEFPTDIIKVDKELTAGAGLQTNRAKTRTLNAIASLARSLGIDIVIEGVETYRQARTLRNMQMVKQQGYLHCKPMRVEEINALQHLGLDVSHPLPPEIRDDLMIRKLRA
ncbi:EAL domain-containing protein [Donghicola mangrovi]|uniref:EAL domain-containing protein n=1 Tax=Donghicola mangrovi TaxID=2729614 RepID=A0A850QAF1_9RHOB|nr:EAL domain-containing protein [Donghicola mangrovi]NVO23269.1 EAL domain-containing protein [Donghicola mangrovi]